MRIAIVSDIHGNLSAFDAVLEDLKKVSPDLVLHGGDLAANGARPAEINDRIRSLGWPGVRGNTDEMLCAPQELALLAAKAPVLAPLLAAFEEMIPVTQTKIGQERLRWLEALPQRLSLENLTVMHASPDDLWRAPLAKAGDAELQAAFGDVGSEIVVYGHIHRPYVRTVGGITVANTGSVSLSYDGDPRASYLIVEDQTITIRRVDYDREREARELLNSGLPHAEWLCRVLRGGRYCPPE